MAPYGDKVWNQCKYRSDFKNAYLKLCRKWSHLRYCHLYFSIFLVQLSVEEEWIQPKFVRHKASAFSELSRACLRSSECVIKCHYVVFVWSKHVFLWSQLRQTSFTKAKMLGGKKCCTCLFSYTWHTKISGGFHHIRRLKNIALGFLLCLIIR